MHHLHYAYGCMQYMYVVGHSTCHMNADVQKDVIGRSNILPSNMSQILHGIHTMSYRTTHKIVNSLRRASSDLHLAWEVGISNTVNTSSGLLNRGLPLLQALAIRFTLGVNFYRLLYNHSAKFVVECYSWYS